MKKRKLLTAAGTLLVICVMVAFFWFRPFCVNDNPTLLLIKSYVWENREEYGIRAVTVYNIYGYVDVLIEPENADYGKILLLYLKYGDAIRVRVQPFNLVVTS